MAAATPAPEPRWPAGDIAVRRAPGAQERTIPQCLGWGVRRFFAAQPGRVRRDLGRGGIEAFLRDLAWQPGVTNPAGGGTRTLTGEKARDALELYYERFRGLALAPRPDGRSRSANSSTASLRPGGAPPATPGVASEPMVGGSESKAQAPLLAAPPAGARLPAVITGHSGAPAPATPAGAARLPRPFTVQALLGAPRATGAVARAGFRGIQRRREVVGTSPGA